MIANDLQGKIAVVTGASRGIGKGIALALANGGAHVACIATKAENADETVVQIRNAGGKAIALGCRVEDAAAVTATFAEVEQQRAFQASGLQVRKRLGDRDPRQL